MAWLPENAISTTDGFPLSAQSIFVLVKFATSMFAGSIHTGTIQSGVIHPGAIMTNPGNSVPPPWSDDGKNF
jgi:hypothetical protein